MDFPMIPSYLVRITPGYYAHRMTGQCVVLEPYQVDQLYWQEVQQWNTQQQYALRSDQYVAPFQGYMPTMTTNFFGPVNVGSSNFIGHHLGNEGQYHDYHVHAGSRANFGAPVHVFAPTGAPVFTPAPVQQLPAQPIDLTEDDSTPASIPAPTAVPPRGAPAPRAKPNRSFWKNGSAYLGKMLNGESGSSTWRLFQSMTASGSSDQKYRYCEAHWPTEKAAYEDIREMSRYFIDASEMLMYALKWDRLGKQSTLENPSEEIRLEQEKLEKEITDERSALMQALPRKKMLKLEEEEHARWSNWVDNLSRQRFKEVFGIKRNPANLEKVKAERADEMAMERAERLAGPKKRKAAKAPVEIGRLSKKPKAGSSAATVDSETVMEDVNDVDAAGETEDESMLDATSDAQPAAPMVVSVPEIALQAGNDVDSESQTDDSVPESPSFWGDLAEEMADSFNADAAAAEADASKQSPLQELSDNLSSPPRDTEKLGEPVTASTITTEQAPQEENTVVANELSDAEVDNFFKGGEASEDLPDATSEEANASQVPEELLDPRSSIAASSPTPSTPPTASDSPATEIPEVAEGLSDPMSDKKLAALTTRRNELTASRAEITELLAEVRAEILEKEVVFHSLIRNLRNPYFKKKMEGRVPGREMELRELREELEGFGQEMAEVEWEMAVLPVLPEREIV